MDLNYAPEEQAFREEVRAFVRANLHGTSPKRCCTTDGW